MNQRRQRVTPETIRHIFSIFNECYPRKFEVTERTHKIWLRMLRDLSSEDVLAAAFHICSRRPDWPPDVATVRRQATDISAGELSPQTGLDAWAHILKKFEYEDFPLTGLEKTALKQVGTIYDLKRSTNPSTDRAHFIKAYDNLVKKQQLERVTLPEVKALIEHNIPLLPETEAATPLPAPETPDLVYPKNGGRVSQDEIKAFSDALAEKMKAKINQTGDGK